MYVEINKVRNNKQSYVVAIAVTILLLVIGNVSFLTLGAHAHEGYSTYFVCVCVCVVFVCSKFAAFKWSLYNKVDLATSVFFRQFFLIFNSRICLRCPSS